MKDQVTTLMEALRLSQLEIEKLRRKRQDLTTTVDHVEAILSDPIRAGCDRQLGNLHWLAQCRA